MSSIVDFQRRLSQKTLNQTLKDLITLAENERKNLSRKARDYYNGDQKHHLREILRATLTDETYSKIRSSIDFHNIVKPIIDQTSIVYKNGADRELLNTNQTQQKLYDSILDNADADQVLQEVNKLTTLLGTVLIKIAWRDGIKYDIITPEILDVIPRLDDPTMPEAIIYAQEFFRDDAERFAGDLTETTPGTSDFTVPGAPHTIFFFWSKTQFFAFDKDLNIIPDLTNDQNANPYGVLPFVVFRSRFPIDQFFVSPSIDLVEAQDTINFYLTQLNHLIKYQSFSILFLKGMDQGKIIVDPAQTISAPLATGSDRGEPDMKFVSPDAKIEDLWRLITERIAWIGKSHGLSLSDFKMSGDSKSGFSIHLENREIQERRKEQLKMYRKWETKKLFPLTKLIYNLHAQAEGLPLLDAKSELKIDFGEIEVPLDPITELAHLNNLASQNLISKLDLMRKLNPDLSEKDARKKLEENEKINKEFKMAEPQLPSPPKPDQMGNSAMNQPPNANKVQDKNKT